MSNYQRKIRRLLLVSMMIALDVVLSPLFRIEGMAPMSSLMNVIGGVLMGQFYGTVMALGCGLIRMLLLGIPPLALTGAIFGAGLAGSFYRLGKSLSWAIWGEIIGTGVIGSLLSYPVMVWFTGTAQELSWLIYTPRFFGGAISGSLLAYVCLINLQKTQIFKRMQHIFERRTNENNSQLSRF